MSRIFLTPKDIYAPLERDIELQLALSHILYGCVPHATEKNCLIIFKERSETVATIADTKEVSTRFFTVEKEEFTSVAMEIKIRTSRDLKMKYEYFFLTDSSEEAFFLATLARLGTFSLIFLCDDAHHSITAQMTESELEPLEKIVSGADADLLTKSGL
ncbi:MAG: hypothetical protein OXC97_00700 [Candidatus Dadabacteria bacterium]|nr:hypothetical protein [Candidatus Dadabacteria bacterium]